MSRVYFLLLIGTSLLSTKSVSAGAHVSVSTPRASVDVYAYGRPRAAARRAVRRAVAVNAALYNPYVAYWGTYPAAGYYKGSFGYWNSSNGAYGAVYTQPGMFSSYHYGPYSYGSTYLTPTAGYHTGLVNFSYSRNPGQSFSLSGSGPWGGSFSLSASR